MLRAMTSSGMSSQVSSTGASGVVSIAPSVGVCVEEDEGSSGCFSGLVGGGTGGGAEDMLERVMNARTTKTE